MSHARWSAVDLSSDPRLLLGRRKSSKKIDVHRVDVHQDLFVDLRAIAESAVDELLRREAKPYATFASMSTDDYFDVDVSDIPQRRDRRKKEEDPEAYEIATALAMIAECDEHNTLTAEELRDSNPTLYAIVFEDEGEYIGFIRNRSPQRTVKPGLRYLQYGDTLRKVDPPDLAIDSDIDVVVAPDRCAVLTPSAFTTLFGDVRIPFQQVPNNIEVMAKAFEGTLPLSETSLAALGERCGTRVIDAKRLHHIVTQREDALKGLGKDRMKDLLKERGLEDVLKPDGLQLTTETVTDFLDLVEGRLFDDDVTGEERRADAYSPRRR
jgi:hypothetical protein